MDLHSEQLHTATPDSYRLFLRRKRLVTLVLLAAVLAAALLSLTTGSAGLSLAENGIDSMGFVELLLSVKRLYGVNLVDAGLRSADVKSVAALAGKICEAGK